jgi:hypothetical protein
MQKTDKLEIVFHLGLYSLVLFVGGLMGYELWKFSTLFIHIILAAK